MPWPRPARDACASALAAILILAPVVARGGEAMRSGAIFCYDAARDAVARTLPGACGGETIDAAEAARRNDARMRHVRAAIGTADGGAPPPPARRDGRLLKGTGSGFFVNETGEILTNFHAVRACGEITASGHGHAAGVLRLVAGAPAIDLAVVKAAAPAPAVARFSRAPGMRGDDHALIVGFSLFGKPSQSATVTAARLGDGVAASEAWRFAFTARVFPGHSGSPLLDAFGEVVGIVHARARPLPGARPDAERPGLAVGLGAARRFLAAHRVRVIDGDAGQRLDDADILAAARRFVVRIECWS
jgi:S1-C subfamily serine protease